MIITDFCLRVYTRRQNNPRTKVRALVNVKMPLKAHGNNVTLESMWCRKCRIYGLSRLSMSVSAGEGDTLTEYDNIAKFIIYIAALLLIYNYHIHYIELLG